MMHRFLNTITVTVISGLTGLAVGCSSGSDEGTPLQDTQVQSDVETSPDGGGHVTGVEGNTEPPLPEVSDAVESVPEAGTGETGITLTAVSPADFQAVLARHRGKVVLVDFWATWCRPCIAGLPHTTKLAHQYAEDGLVVLTMCMADGTDTEETELALTKLKDSHVDLKNYVCTLGGGDESFDAYNIGESGLPHYKIYDRTGKLATELRNDVDAGIAVHATDVDQYVEKILAE